MYYPINYGYVEEKWVVAPEGTVFMKEEIKEQIHFQEQYFDSEIVVLKSTAYYEAFRMPVFSCNSGLYFENVPDEVQPGVHVRNVDGKCNLLCNGWRTYL